MRSRLLAVGAAVAASLAFTVGFAAAPADADTSVTSTATIRNAPDDGNPAWARDTFTRTTTITPGEKAGTYLVKIADKGTFKTHKGAKSPNDAGTKMRKDTGTLTGSGEFTVTGAKLRGHNGLNRLDGRIYHEGKYATKADVPTKFTTAHWALQFFKKGAQGSGITNWTWTYKTQCESMTQTPDGVTGNITGKKQCFMPSVLKAANKCRASKTNKANFWTVSNVQGGRDRTYWLHVSYGGKTTYEGQHSVAAGDTAVVRTSHGGKLTVGYYDGAAHHKYAYAWSDAKKLCG